MSAEESTKADELTSLFELHISPAYAEGAVTFFDAMHLKADVSFGVIGLFEISGRHAIHKALVVIALDHDSVEIPLALFEGCFCRVRADGLRSRQDAPPGSAAGFVIKITRCSIDGDFTLRAIKSTGRKWLSAFGSLGGRITLLCEATSHLDARIQSVVDVDLKLEFEVFKGTHDEERIRTAVSGGAHEDTVLHFVSGGSADDFGIAQTFLEPVLPAVFGLKGQRADEERGKNEGSDKGWFHGES